MNEYLELIKEFGFPVFVCVWFMLRTEKVINTNTKALKEVSENIQRCNK